MARARGRSPPLPLRTILTSRRAPLERDVHLRREEGLGGGGGQRASERKRVRPGLGGGRGRWPPRPVTRLCEGASGPDPGERSVPPGRAALPSPHCVAVAGPSRRRFPCAGQAAAAGPLSALRARWGPRPRERRSLTPPGSPPGLAGPQPRAPPAPGPPHGRLCAQPSASGPPSPSGGRSPQHRWFGEAPRRWAAAAAGSAAPQCRSLRTRGAVKRLHMGRRPSQLCLHARRNPPQLTATAGRRFFF